MDYTVDGCRRLLLAIVAQAVYDYDAAVRAGAMDAAGRIRQPRQRTVASTGRRSGLLLGHGNSTLAASMTMGDLFDLNRQVTSDRWVDSLRSATGVPLTSARQFRQLSISRPRQSATQRFNINSLAAAFVSR
ncbi:MAG: hypothetical protein ACO3LT_09340 [Ilumatobacteraceae bacterium]